MTATPTATILFMASSLSESLLLSSISLRSSCLNHTRGKKIPIFTFLPGFSPFFLLPACHQASNPTLHHEIFMGTGVGLQPGERGTGGTGMVLAPSAIPIPGTGTRTPSHPGCGCHPTLSLNHRCPSPAPSWLGWVSHVPSFTWWHGCASTPR